MNRASRTRYSREFDPEASGVYGGFGVTALTLGNREKAPRQRSQRQRGSDPIPTRSDP